ncbi:hypothetical protein PIIN_11532 [Serendipita indica DSM 11827]|uniref:Uncharacterized protein n=1 Tax=Serendipita indica (strain DSM 11827) TaxID=1109443 RepID=G4U1W2_SERID|nr:hypothetical protein PIIN_11532 [Serendipita indica DSM 11827]
MGTQEVLTSWTQPHCRHSPHCSRTQFGDYANDDEENFVLNVIQ